MAKQKNITLTQEEIETFKSVAQEQQQITVELGRLVLTEKQLEQQYTQNKEQVSSQRQQLIDVYSQSIQKQQDHSKSLVEKYGEGTLNTDTWEFTPTEK
jgi:hypothetical protein